MIAPGRPEHKERSAGGRGRLDQVAKLAQRDRQRREVERPARADLAEDAQAALHRRAICVDPAVETGRRSGRLGGANGRS